jgi:hypothetical protein
VARPRAHRVTALAQKLHIAQPAVRVTLMASRVHAQPRRRGPLAPGDRVDVFVY